MIAPAAVANASRMAISGHPKWIGNPSMLHANAVHRVKPSTVRAVAGKSPGSARGAILQIVSLRALFCFSGTIVNLAVAILAARAGKAAAGSSPSTRWLRRASAGILGFLAVRLALAARP